MSHSAGRATWGALAFIAIASTIISLNPVRQVTGAEQTITDPCLNHTQGQSCDDKKSCTYNTVCLNQSGTLQCIGTANDTACNDWNECTVDKCDPSSSAYATGWTGCVHNTTALNGTSCLDGACTINQVCSGGSCGGGTAVNCTAYNTQCAVARCDAGGAEGNCDTLDPAPLNNTACDNMGAVKCVVNPPAQCLNGNCTSAPDADGDAICDANDERPNEFDPTGYFYEERTARIIPGGKVAVACAPPNSWILKQLLDGSTGQYMFTLLDLPATEITCKLTITPPLGCALSKTCLPSMTPLDPPTGGAEYVVGNYPSISDPSSLSSNACTPWYTAIELQAGDPEVINNNIPVRCPDVKAPTASKWGLGAMTLLLMVTAFVLLRRNARQA